jgi:MFS-type transporter involved in bile tolerance (Atg22 family)
MGIYIFSGLVLAWLPPLLFSFLNEIGASMTIGLASLNLFFVGGFVLLLMIGDYDEAVALAQVEDDVVWTAIDDAVVRNIPELT